MRGVSDLLTQASREAEERRVSAEIEAATLNIDRIRNALNKIQDIIPDTALQDTRYHSRYRIIEQDYSYFIRRCD